MLSPQIKQMQILPTWLPTTSDELRYPLIADD
jgi:hypothetical protein